MEKFGSVRFSTLNLRMPNQTIRSVQQFSGTLNGTWRSGSKSIQFAFGSRSVRVRTAFERKRAGGRRWDSLVGVLWATSLMPPSFVMLPPFVTPPSSVPPPLSVMPLSSVMLMPVTPMPVTPMPVMPMPVTPMPPLSVPPCSSVLPTPPSLRPHLTVHR